MTYEVMVPVHQVIYGMVYASIEADSVEEAMSLVEKNGANHYIDFDSELNRSILESSIQYGRWEDLDDYALSLFNDADNYTNEDN